MTQDEIDSHLWQDGYDAAMYGELVDLDNESPFFVAGYEEATERINGRN